MRDMAMRFLNGDLSRRGFLYIIDALIERTGPGADLTWHPPFSVAGIRTKNV
jgi:hypothetical protein